MRVLGLILLLCGILSLALCQTCVLDTLRCSRMWPIISPHKSLVDNEDELNIVCMLQEKFYTCIENATLHAREELHPVLLRSKILSRQLCRKDSLFRKKYFESVKCINDQDVDYCFESEFDDFDVEITKDGCLLRDKIINCIAVHLSFNCKHSAADVFRQMFLMTDLDSTCYGEDEETAYPKNNAVNREQIYRLYSKDKDTAGIFIKHRIGLENEDETMPEAIEAALDSILDAESNVVNTEAAELSPDVPSSDENFSNFQESSKNLNMPDPESDAIVYNHEDGRISIYWIQLGFIPIENITCSHEAATNIFYCAVEPRKHDPQCLQYNKFKVVKPEDVDPELGADLYEIHPNKGYLFQQWLNKDKLIKIFPDSDDSSASQMTKCVDCKVDVQSSTESNFKNSEKEFDIHRIGDMNEIDVDTDTLKESEILIANTDTDPDDNAKYISIQALNHPSKILKLPIEKFPTNVGIIPDTIKTEMAKLFSMDEAVAAPVKIMQHQSGRTDMFWEHKEDSPIESITCGRVNECHPEAKGVFKCLIVPRDLKQNNENDFAKNELQGSDIEANSSEISSDMTDFEPNENVIAYVTEDSMPETEGTLDVTVENLEPESSHAKMSEDSNIYTISSDGTSIQKLDDDVTLVLLDSDDLSNNSKILYSIESEQETNGEINTLPNEVDREGLFYVQII